MKRNIEEFSPALAGATGLLANADRKTNKFGYANSLSTTLETISTLGGIRDRIPSATVLKISSTDANDTAAGSGMRTVEVTGVNSNWEHATETVSLDGQTVVLTTTEWVDVFRLKQKSVGATGSNEGMIWCGDGTVTSGVPATKYANIVIGKNQSQVSFYTVSANHYALLVKMRLTASKGKNLLFELKASDGDGSAMMLKETYDLYQNIAEFDFIDDPLIFNEKTFIRVDGVSDGAGTDASASFTIFEIPY